MFFFISFVETCLAAYVYQSIGLI